MAMSMSRRKEVTDYLLCSIDVSFRLSEESEERI